MKRIFIGAKIGLKEEIYNSIKEDFASCIYGKWVEYHNLHVTEKFIGDVEDKYVPIIKGILIDDLRQYDVNMNIGGLGFFPQMVNAKVLMLKLKEENNILHAISNTINDKLFEMGIAKEEKKFKPHLTLCRIKSSNLSVMRSIAEKYKDKPLQFISSIRVEMFESKLTKSGPIYTVL